MSVLSNDDPRALVAEAVSRLRHPSQTRTRREDKVLDLLVRAMAALSPSAQPVQDPPTPVKG